MKVVKLLPIKFFLCCALLCVPACTSMNSKQQSPTAAPTEVQAGADSETRGLAEREMVRRQQATQDSLELMEEGNRMRAAGDLEGATRSYQQSLEKLPR